MVFNSLLGEKTVTNTKKSGTHLVYYVNKRYVSNPQSSVISSTINTLKLFVKKAVSCCAFAHTQEVLPIYVTRFAITNRIVTNNLIL